MAWLSFFNWLPTAAGKGKDICSPSSSYLFPVSSCCSLSSILLSSSINQGKDRNLLQLYKGFLSFYKRRIHAACLIKWRNRRRRNGFLEEAKGYPSWPGVCRSFVNGCRIHGEKELGKMGAKKLMELFPEKNAEGYVLLSKIYCEEGNWEDGWKVRKEMSERWGCYF